MKEINPQETTRAYAFEMWMNAPMPMVTFFKTLNVSRLVKISRKSGIKYNRIKENTWIIMHNLATTSSSPLHAFFTVLANGLTHCLLFSLLFLKPKSLEPARI